MMRVDIAKIKPKALLAADFSFCQPLDAAAYGFREFILVGPLKVAGSLVNQGGGRYLARFSYQAQLEMVCGRCGQPFVQTLAGEASAHYSADGQPDGAGEEEVYPLDGDQVDLAEPALNELGFQLPMQPLCRPDCRGLCPVCGLDLNHNSCSCQRETIDPRWEKLRNLVNDD